MHTELFIPQAEECCQEKRVGNRSYSLLPEGEDFAGPLPKQCLNTCVYTEKGKSSPKFCFAQGFVSSKMCRVFLVKFLPSNNFLLPGKFQPECLSEASPETPGSLETPSKQLPFFYHVIDLWIFFPTNNPHPLSYQGCPSIRKSTVSTGKFVRILTHSKNIFSFNNVNFEPEPLIVRLFQKQRHKNNMNIL